MRYAARSNFWYHVTQRRWGDKKTLIPRDIGSNRPECEPKIARICVAPTVAHCLISIPLYNASPVYIYRTYRKCKAIIPWKVEDVRATKERWIIQPTVFLRRAIIEPYQIDFNTRIGMGTYEGVPGQIEELQRLRDEMEKKGMLLTP